VRLQVRVASLDLCVFNVQLCVVRVKTASVAVVAVGGMLMACGALVNGSCGSSVLHRGACLRDPFDSCGLPRSRRFLRLRIDWLDVDHGSVGLIGATGIIADG
jgi:hypothetical protein